MARQKRNSAVLEQAKRRFESMRSINSELDLGGGLNLQLFDTAIQELESYLGTYNTSLSEVDQHGDNVRVSEGVVKEISAKLLLGIASRYGKNSQEYEMVGGRRRKGRPRRIVAQSETAALASGET